MSDHHAEMVIPYVYMQKHAPTPCYFASESFGPIMVRVLVITFFVKRSKMDKDFVP